MLSSLLLTMFLGSAQAAPPMMERIDPEPTPPSEDSGLAAPEGVMVIISGVGEFWHDAAIASTYRSGGIVPTIAAVVPVTDFIAVNGSIGYHRATPVTDSQGRLQLVPMSLIGEFRLKPQSDSGMEVFAGAGPAMMLWSESGQDPKVLGAEDPSLAVTVLRGARPGFEVRTGIRADLGLIEPSLLSSQQDSLRGVMLEVIGARRFASGSTGFNFNTWRVGAGLALVF